jgi:uncharacterized protein (DUF58 family)
MAAISLRPTPLAWALLGITLCLLMMAMNYQNNIAYLLCSAVFSAAIFAAIEARRNLRGMSLETQPVKACFVGQYGSMGAIIRVEDERPRLLLRLALPDAYSMHVLELQGRHGLAMPLPAWPRGVHRLEYCELESVHPFGLVRSRLRLSLDQELVIYPEPLGERPLPGGGGQDQGHKRGEGDFAGHRRYQDGEPPARLDWKVIARDGPLLVKHFTVGSGRQEHLLSLSALAAVPVEHALSQLCRWICQAEERHEPYQLALAENPGELGQGASHQHRCLEQLARYRGRLS